MSEDGGITAGPAAAARPGYLPTVTSTPDWAALAERNAQEAKRRRQLRIGGGVLGVVLVGGLTAGLLATRGGGGGEPEPSRTVAGSQAPTELLPVGPEELPSPSGSPSGSPSASASASASASPSASASKTPTATGAAKAPSGTPAQPSGPAQPPAAGGGQPAPSAAPGGAAPPPAPPAPPSRLDDRLGRFPIGLSGSPVVGQLDGRTALQLNGRGEGYGQSSGPVVNTDASFTVSALVRNNAPTGGRAVVTQGDGTYHSFHLGRDYWDAHNQWVFKVQQGTKGSDSTTTQALSKEDATTGRWTLLTGVYDAGAKKITLYVDGQAAQTTSVTGIWKTDGPLQIGRTRYKSGWTDFWDGAITNVQLWDRPLTGDQVKRLAGSGGVNAGIGAYAAWLLP
ncbi:LamG domain-containing protein [Kitasatospora sp. NPDC096147]|uniref:LamG domain-containing protein n=1 Tax=Kitasatospora sp. NPDC096147 TaxID=3364093 RepID=UPI003809AB2C